MGRIYTEMGSRRYFVILQSKTFPRMVPPCHVGFEQGILSSFYISSFVVRIFLLFDILNGLGDIIIDDGLLLGNIYRVENSMIGVIDEQLNADQEFMWLLNQTRVTQSTRRKGRVGNFRVV